MNTVCEVCGDIGFKQQIICCRDCKDSAAHKYCLGIFTSDGSLADWLCLKCQQRSGEVTCRGSLEKVSSEKPSHVHSGSTLEQPIAKRLRSCKSAMDAGPSGTKSNVQTTGSHSNRKRCNTIAKRLRSRETIGTETTKDDNAESQQVDDEKSASSSSIRQSPPAPMIVCFLGYKLGNRSIEGVHRRWKRTSESVKAQSKGSLKKTSNEALGSTSTTYRVLENVGANLSSKHTDQAKSLPEDSTAELGICLDFGKNKRRKRRRLIPLSQKFDSPKKKNKVEETVQAGDLSDSDASNGGPAKKQRRYIDSSGDEDEEAVTDVAKASSAQNDVANSAHDGGANLESQTAVAEEHPVRSNSTSKTYSPATVHGNSVLENVGTNLSSKHTDQAKSLPEDNTEELGISLNFGKNKRRKRRCLIIQDD